MSLPGLDVPTGLVELDARYSRGRFETRRQYAHVFIDGAAALNRAVDRLTGISPNVAGRMRGCYVEGAYRVLPRRFARDRALFARYENFDTQFRMDVGDVNLPEFDRDAWVVGGTSWLDPDVALKVDCSHVRSLSFFGSPPAALHADTPAQDAPAARRVVRMSAERFLFTPSEITVEEGTVLEIRVTSDDTDHGFCIIGSPVDVSIPKRNRGEAVAVFAATKPGDYTFECSHMCGAGHGFMRGRIRVKAWASGRAKKTGDSR